MASEIPQQVQQPQPTAVPVAVPPTEAPVLQPNQMADSPGRLLQLDALAKKRSYCNKCCFFFCGRTGNDLDPDGEVNKFIKLPDDRDLRKAVLLEVGGWDEQHEDFNRVLEKRKLFACRIHLKDEYREPKRFGGRWKWTSDKFRPAQDDPVYKGEVRTTSSTSPRRFYRRASGRKRSAENDEGAILPQIKRPSTAPVSSMSKEPTSVQLVVEGSEQDIDPAGVDQHRELQAMFKKQEVSSLTQRVYHLQAQLKQLQQTCVDLRLTNATLEERLVLKEKTIKAYEQQFGAMDQNGTVQVQVPPHSQPTAVDTVVASQAHQHLPDDPNTNQNQTA